MSTCVVWDQTDVKDNSFEKCFVLVIIVEFYGERRAGLAVGKIEDSVYFFVVSQAPQGQVA